MLSLYYELIRKNDGQLVLKLNSRFRYVFVVLLAVVVGGTLVSGGLRFDAGSILPLLLSLLFLAVILYEESWYFDSRRGSIRHDHGLLIAKRRHRYAVDELERFELRRFRKGRTGEREEKKRYFQKDFVRIAMIFKGGGEKDIQVIEEKHRPALERQIERVAELMGVEFRREE
jgi:hypothetical protein